MRSLRGSCQSPTWRSQHTGTYREHRTALCSRNSAEASDPRQSAAAAPQQELVARHMANPAPKGTYGVLRGSTIFSRWREQFGRWIYVYIYIYIHIYIYIYIYMLPPPIDLPLLLFFCILLHTDHGTTKEASTDGSGWLSLHLEEATRISTQASININTSEQQHQQQRPVACPLQAMKFPGPFTWTRTAKVAKHLDPLKLCRTTLPERYVHTYLCWGSKEHPIAMSHD